MRLWRTRPIRFGKFIERRRSTEKWKAEEEMIREWWVRRHEDLEVGSRRWVHHFERRGVA